MVNLFQDKTNLTDNQSALVDSWGGTWHTHRPG